MHNTPLDQESLAATIDRETLATRLAPTSPTPTRIEVFLKLGLEVEELAAALDITPNTVRNWLNGDATPRRAAVRVIDDIRQTLLVLSEVGIEGVDAAQWLRSRQGGALENDRPLEVIRTDPVRVLAAAHGLVVGEGGGVPPGLRVL